MARILAISSFVAHGHVGLSAILPALTRLGHEVIALPTILLSNHPGQARFAGTEVDPASLRRMLDALDANGCLAETDAVMTGYMPSPAHVRFAQDAVTRVRTRPAGALILVDPIIGDDPKGLYVDKAVAVAIRDQLLPIADVATPNRFELGWLAGRPVEGLESALAASEALVVPVMLATSIPAPQNRLATVLIDNGHAHACVVPRLDGVPHGTGDFLAALFMAARLRGASNVEALAVAAGGTATAIAASQGFRELQLVASQEVWSGAPPLAVEAL